MHDYIWLFSGSGSTVCETSEHSHFGWAAPPAVIPPVPGLVLAHPLLCLAQVGSKAQIHRELPSSGGDGDEFHISNTLSQPVLLYLPLFIVVPFCTGEGFPILYPNTLQKWRFWPPWLQQAIAPRQTLLLCMSAAVTFHSSRATKAADLLAAYLGFIKANYMRK